MRPLLRAALASLGWACLVPPALAQERDLADRLVAAYAKLGSYCARAQQSQRAGDGAAPAMKMEHCVLRDGRFRSVVTSPRQLNVEWSDGEFQHSHHRITGERPFDSYVRVAAARMSAPDVLPILQRALGWYWLGVADMAGLRERFKAFEPKAELSTATLVAYEAPPGDPMAGQRVWIGREDGVIRRVGWRNPDVGEIVLTEVRLDPVLSPEALRHEAPAAARYRYAVKQNLLELALAASALGFALGFAYGRLRRRAAGDEATARARAWRIYRWLLAITAPLAILLGLFAPTGDGMEAAARLIEHLAWTIAWLYLLWLAGLFLLGRSASARGAGNPKRG
ncbi:MAG: hypothetical protein WAO95_17355 [Burkholderiales bacterium]